MCGTKGGKLRVMLAIILFVYATNTRRPCRAAQVRTCIRQVLHNLLFSRLVEYIYIYIYIYIFMYSGVVLKTVGSWGA